MKVQLGKAFLTVLFFLMCGTAAVAATGVLNVTVRDENNALAPGVTVIFYTGSTVSASVDTDANGLASATLEAGSHSFEVYGTDGFWGGASATVVAATNTDVAFKRREPILTEVKVYNGAVDVTNGTVAAGTTLTVQIKATDIGPTNRAVRIKLTLDNDKLAPLDSVQTSGAQTILNSGGIKTYTFSYTPLLGGPWYSQIEVQSLISGKFDVTDSVDWQSLITVTPGAANLSVTVLDENGATVPGAKVYRYPLAGGAALDMMTTDSSGVATWPTPVDSMEYYMEVYVGTAFWTEGTVAVPLGSTTNAILTRTEPFVSDFHVFNASTNADVTNSYVQTGTTLRLEVTVSNRTTSDRTSRVTLYFDRSRSSSWDFYQRSAQATVPAEGNTVFTFTYRPTSSGTYFRRAQVETYYSFNNAFAFTDLPSSWTSAVTVTNSAPIVISGHVLTSGDDPMDEVILRAIASDGVTIVAEATTDDDGAYSLVVPSCWTGRVMVVEFEDYPGYTFYPALRSYSCIKTAQTNQDFTGYAPITISGHIYPHHTTGVGTINGVSGVVVNASNGGGTSTTNNLGFYSLTVPGGPSGWTGFVTPTPDGYAFDPVFRNYSGITANQTNQDFTAYAGDTVDHLVITGLVKIGEGLSTDYTCTAYYTSARTADVTLVAAWSDNSSYATINSAGHLTASNVSSDKTVQLTAAYGGKTTTFTLTILNVVSITIAGPTSVNESSSADYTCTAHYSDSSTANVTSATQWSVDSSYATINSAGHLTTSAVTRNRSARITARYGGLTGTLNITILNL